MTFDIDPSSGPLGLQEHVKGITLNTRQGLGLSSSLDIATHSILSIMKIH